MLRRSFLLGRGVALRSTARLFGGGGGGIRLPDDDGISAELRGFGEYGGSISAFVKAGGEDQGKRVGGSKVFPCGEADPTIQAVKAQHMAEIAKTGKLPSPRNVVSTSGSSATPKGGHDGVGHATAGMASSSSLPRRVASLPREAAANYPATLARNETTNSARDLGGPEGQSRAKEAEDYYRAVPRNALSKEEMWRRITTATSDKAERASSTLHASEEDYLKMEEELQEHDLYHFRIGELAFPEQRLRRNYYAMWLLAMYLNKARWTMLDVHSQRGVKTTGAGMKLLFWKESVSQIMEKRSMPAGQFTDSHPVLRPFAAVVEQNPHMTKAFVRGFSEARLRVIQQPGNVKQLFDHFDRYYGYFFNSLLEVAQVKDENAGHLMQHIGRAIGLTQHCVMFWKKYARIGFTMLPADLCADNHVNLALLRNISLAARDRAVRRLLYDVMCIVKTEMLHAQQLAPHCSPAAWPIVMECTYANYYLGFLQRRDFNVSAMFADNNVENAGFAWYRVKKRWEWEKHQSIERLVAESAPLPFIGTSWGHRGSDYKIASGFGRK
ncbi:hypothetical protein, conserved [Trypanosoma brucei brucei TREU927]|uniref:Phytoene synthase n=1 Tax=Trypanosoma brucei brucei (strain 927/4 GUTat10.1) TaxID=185431 RepID=Q383T9_TRYB2|nr:hypothetical protein, conserved [Trypanosoma brucei brucei TREU927]EAN79942.1 hypothetical protein, conserved [Trypanosoma brucei brucei TREU927]